jgi:predicted HicB family RNase H-like nuclease
MAMEREQTTIRLPASLKEALMREAQEKGISFNAYVLLLIDKARLHRQQ